MNSKANELYEQAYALVKRAMAADADGCKTNADIRKAALRALWLACEITNTAFGALRAVEEGGAR